ncbi:DUF3618 domain-containing protein [Streptomyces sp. So13.3]|uniref:DUF3618 domain-containing protein n=1 Tax=Streptomyces sp. So13.3 TaxID=2136173 RepID=UPI0011069C43|nr:DUF3618 domain-containing protein [Streptomyces sp. So13.3]QNA77426.1 DUF3618 domain-containing protein [Streptomyces sp. So13.3]
MTDKKTDDSTPTPEELRERVEDTREQLGQTVEALAAKANVKARAQGKAAEVQAEVRERAADAKDGMREKVTHTVGRVQDATSRAVHAAQDRTPEPAREKAWQAGEQLIAVASTAAGSVSEHTPAWVRDTAGKAAQAARRNPTATVVAAAGAAVAVWAVRRGMRQSNHAR